MFKIKEKEFNMEILLRLRHWKEFYLTLMMIIHFENIFKKKLII